MKIVYVLPTLAWKGGAERIITERVNYFAEHFGYDIVVVCIIQGKDQANTYPISKKITQINLSIEVHLQYKYSYPKRLWIQYILHNQIKRQLKNAIQQINPDILIGVGYYRANLVCAINCRGKKIIECHDARRKVVSDFMINNKWLTPLLMAIYKKLYFKSIERYADVIITEREKGFERLIEIWGLVCRKYPDWHLDIYGEGKMYDALITLTNIHKASNVTIHHFTPNISYEYSTSSICATTSYFEGFSLVILEAMKHGVPCVAFDCPFGPRSIINDGYDGFLVKNGDIKLFAERLYRLIEDEGLRKQFSERAIEKSLQFDTNTIMQKWKNLFEQELLCSNKL